MSDGVKKITAKVKSELKNFETKVKTKAKEFNEKKELSKNPVMQGEMI